MRISSRFLIGLAAAALTYLSLTALMGSPRHWGDRAYGEGYYHCDRAAGGWHRHAGVPE